MTSYTDTSPLDAADITPGETEIVRNIGKTSHMGGRMPAFAGLAKATGGLYVEDQEGMSVDDALAKSGLDFTVEAIEAPQVAVTSDAGMEWVEHPSYRMNVARHANGKITPVGMTKGRYQIVQNSEAFAFAQILIGEGGANVAAAGSYGNPSGSKTYLALMLDPFTVAGDDHQMFVTILNSHDGSGSLQAMLAPIRIRCTNQTHAIFKGAAQRIALRHTVSIEGRIDEAREVLGLVGRWEENFQRAATQLLDTPMTNTEFATFTDELWTPPAAGSTKRKVNTHTNRTDELVALFANAETNDFGRGTRYAALNAVTEYLDWNRPVHGGDSPDVARYTRTLDSAGQGVDRKALAFATLIAA
jgi:phage/plasmid-like protein (TIGR03299 family)